MIVSLFFSLPQFGEQKLFSFFSPLFYTSLATTGAGYPRGWEYLPDAEKYYRPVFELVTWEVAQQRCGEFGPRSRLVDINDERESEAIRAFIARFDRESITKYNAGCRAQFFHHHRHLFAPVMTSKSKHVQRQHSRAGQQG